MEPTSAAQTHLPSSALPSHQDRDRDQRCHGREADRNGEDVEPRHAGSSSMPHGLRQGCQHSILAGPTASGAPPAAGAAAELPRRDGRTHRHRDRDRRGTEAAEGQAEIGPTGDCTRERPAYLSVISWQCRF
jgi:hypothetical protein